MFLAYLDDGGKGDVLVFGGIVVNEEAFLALEMNVGLLVNRLIPDERFDSFDRFHASDLFTGTNAFKGLPETDRHAALRQLVSLPRVLGLPYIYSAIDRRELNRSALKSANPIDIGFSMCAPAMNDIVMRGFSARITAWLAVPESQRPPLANLHPPLTLFIIDTPNNEKSGHEIRRSFRKMRQHLRFKRVPTEPVGEMKLFLSHDDLYFGSSIDSIGLQVADACNYAMWRYLVDRTDGDFYRELAPQSVCARTDPDWSRYRGLFIDHAEA